MATSHSASVLDPDDVRARLAAYFAEASVRFSLLYGSYARRQPTPVSDVDVAVYAERTDDFLDLAAGVEAVFPKRRVDLVNLRGQPAGFYYAALAEGTLLTVQDEAFFQQEKLRVMRAYLDFKPTRDRFLSDMAQRIEEGTYGRRAR